MFVKGLNYPRRKLLTALAALVLLATPVVNRVQPASADDWCWNDPVINVNGQTVSINVGVHGTAAAVQATVTLATITVHIPSNVPGSVVSTGTALPPEKTVIVRDLPRWYGGPIPMDINTVFSYTGPSIAMATAYMITPPAGTIMATPSLGTIANGLHHHLAIPAPAHAPGGEHDEGGHAGQQSHDD